MKLRLSQKHNAAMTMFEVGLVVAVVLTLAVIFLSRTARSYSPEAVCIKNLNQAGLAFKIWAGDNNDVYPMGVSVTNGGSMEMVTTGNVLATFLVMSDELGSSRVLFCPADMGRAAANNFLAGVTSSNLSYFVNAAMTNEDNPQTIVTGDSDWMLGGKNLKPGLASLWTNDPVAWGNRHPQSEHISLADGSVKTMTSANLRNQIKQSGLATNRFALP